MIADQPTTNWVLPNPCYIPTFYFCYLVHFICECFYLLFLCIFEIQVLKLKNLFLMRCKHSLGFLHPSSLSFSFFLFFFSFTIKTFTSSLVKLVSTFFFQEMNTYIHWYERKIVLFFYLYSFVIQHLFYLL